MKYNGNDFTPCNWAESVDLLRSPGNLRIATPLSFGTPHLAPVLAELAQRRPFLQANTCYRDHFIDIVGEGFDCAVRVGYLRDSNLFARRIEPIWGRLVASSGYIRGHGAPDTPDELLTHQILMQGTEAWHFIHGDQTITVHPQGRFKADNGAALAAAAVAGIGIASLPNFLTEKAVASGALVPVMNRYPLSRSRHLRHSATRASPGAKDTGPH